MVPWTYVPTTTSHRSLMCVKAMKRIASEPPPSCVGLVSPNSTHLLLPFLLLLLHHNHLLLLLFFPPPGCPSYWRPSCNRRPTRHSSLWRPSVVLMRSLASYAMKGVYNEIMVASTTMFSFPSPPLPPPPPPPSQVACYLHSWGQGSV